MDLTVANRPPDAVQTGKVALRILIFGGAVLFRQAVPDPIRTVLLLSGLQQAQKNGRRLARRPSLV
jgi:hypothetical protein